MICFLIDFKTKIIKCFRSSRSHCITLIMLSGKHEARNETCIGNLILVDLAGSESLSTGKDQKQKAETNSINNSLVVLQNVLRNLSNKINIERYNDSKLTHLLRPSLEGNSKILMFVNISQLDDCYKQTLDSLKFAQIVQNCVRGGAKKQCQKTV